MTVEGGYDGGYAPGPTASVKSKTDHRLAVSWRVSLGPLVGRIRPDGRGRPYGDASVPLL